MSVIDFRVRPLYKNYQSGFTDGVIRRFFDVFGYELTDSVKDRTMEALIKELDEADVIKSVIPGRAIPGFDNGQLFEIAEQYPDRFIVYPFLDITDVDSALKDIDVFIINGKGEGASIEPGIGNNYKFDDERIFPVYEKLEKNDIPVIVTVSGWVSKVFDVTLPAQVDTVLNNFPRLKFIAAHAAWPFLKEIVAVAFKHPNLYLTADFEGTRGVGAHDLRDGALHMVKNQVLFASSFPLGPVAQGVQSVRDWKLPADIERKILFDNAAGILGL